MLTIKSIKFHKFHNSNTKPSRSAWLLFIEGKSLQYIPHPVRQKYRLPIRTGKSDSFLKSFTAFSIFVEIY